VWLEETANQRVHGTTGRRPIELFDEERVRLTPLASIGAYRFLDPVRRSVSWESMVHYQGSRYSVPLQYAGQTVEVAAAGGQIIVRQGDVIVAEHRQATAAGQSIVQRDHLAELWKITERQVPVPTGPRWHVDFAPTVQTTPLSSYEEVLA
jgi:hypothetical protein